MARTKKVKEEIKEEKKQEIDYGTGWARINNMLQAGKDLEVKK